MDNKVKFQTRIVAVQVIFESLFNQKKILNLKEEFDQFYRNQIIDQQGKRIKYNVNLLTKFIDFYISSSLTINFNEKINKLINFNRSFSRWDLINQTIIIMAVSEIRNTDKKKKKIVINEYIEISKLFVNSKDVKIINAILDKFFKEELNDS